MSGVTGLWARASGLCPTQHAVFWPVPKGQKEGVGMLSHMGEGEEHKEAFLTNSEMNSQREAVPTQKSRRWVRVLGLVSAVGEQGSQIQPERTSLGYWVCTGLPCWLLLTVNKRSLRGSGSTH